jgi:hypothetical protein
VNYYLPEGQTVSISVGTVDMLTSDSNFFSPNALLAFFGVWFYPLALTFLLPVFVFNLVVEKEDRLAEIMKIVK